METAQGQVESLSVESAASVSSPSKPEVVLAGIARLLEIRPMLFWGGLWSALLVVAIAAIATILSPGAPDSQLASKPTARRHVPAPSLQEPAPEAVETPTAPPSVKPVPVAKPAASASPQQLQLARRNSEIPLWLFGAIGVSCLGGSILISRKLRRPKPIRRLKPRRAALPPKPARPVLAPQAEMPRLAPAKVKAKRVKKRVQVPSPAVAKPRRAHPHPALPAPTLFADPQPMSSSPTRSARPSQPLVSPTPSPRPPLKSKKAKRPAASRPIAAASMAVSRVVASVVPADEAHPLDWQANSLADAVDVRKRRTLSSWL